MDNKLYIAKGENPLYLLPQMANRHGLITGATGTGKTVTLKVIAESFSAIGTPVFLTDIKGTWPACALPGSAMSSWRSGSVPWDLVISTTRLSRSNTGMFLASRACQSVPPYRRWDRSCCLVC